MKRIKTVKALGSVMKSRKFAMAMLVGVGTVFTAVTADAVTGDSTTWEGFYEGSVLPTVAGLTLTAGDQADSFIVSPPTNDPGSSLYFDGGALATTPGTDVLLFNAPAPVPFSFATGASVEMRFQEVESNIGAKLAIEFRDPGTGKAVFVGWQRSNANPGGHFFMNSAPDYPFTLDVNAGFHVLRVTAVGSLGNVAQAFLDGNPTPIMTTSTMSDTAPNNFIFGDFGPNTVYLDYIRWTSAGAFDVPEPSTAWLAGVPLLALGRRLLRRK